MSLSSTGRTPKQSKKIPLRFVLAASFAVQIVGGVGLVGYLSFRNGQKAVEDVAQQLMGETGKRIEEKLTAFVETPHLINQLNADALERGELNLNLERAQLQGEKFLWQQMQSFGYSKVSRTNQAQQNRTAKRDSVILWKWWRFLTVTV